MVEEPAAVNAGAAADVEDRRGWWGQVGFEALEGAGELERPGEVGVLEAAGCSRYVVTDVGQDGSLGGPNVELLAGVCAATRRPVIASGGVGSLEDLRTLAALDGVEGAVVGNALYAGRFTLPEVLAALG